MAREANSCELPAFLGLEKVAIGAANMTAGSGAGAAAQDVLVAHELTVVSAECARRSAITGVGGISGPRPFPDVAKHLMEMSILSRDCRGFRMKLLDLDEVSFDRQITRGTFPFEFRGESRSVPICEGVGFEIADVGHRLGFIDRPKTRKSELPPGAIVFHPIERRLPALFVHCHPAE